MLKTAALAALVVLDDLLPKPVPRAETYVSKRVPMLTVVDDEPPMKLKKSATRPRKPRKRHVCYWADDQVWGVFILGFIFGAIVVAWF